MIRSPCITCIDKDKDKNICMIKCEKLIKFRSYLKEQNHNLKAVDTRETYDVNFD